MSENTIPLLLGAGAAGGLLWYASRPEAHARPLGEPKDSPHSAESAAATATAPRAQAPASAASAPAPSAPTASAPASGAPSGTRRPERVSPEAAAETPSPLPGRWVWPVEV